MKNFDLLNIEKEGHVAVVTMAAEPVNALTAELVEELYEAFDALESDGEVWCVVLQSGKKLFAAGADLRELLSVDREGNRATSRRMQRTFLKIEEFPRPVIAAVNGVAFGGGLELALSCDLRVFEARTKVAFPECGLGIIPGAGGTQRLTRLVGPGTAKRLIFTGEVIRGEEAHRLGICEYYEAERSCGEKAMEIARAICEKAPMAVAESKKCISFAMEQGLMMGLEYECELGSGLFETHDKNEGIGAFLEKRSPLFENR